MRVLTSNAIFIRRTAGIGVMPAEMAIDYGCTGPVLRGSGVNWDLRRDGEPRYTRMYEGYKFEVIAAGQRPLSAGLSLSAGAGARPCWATAGTASTCGCWRWCSRWS